MSKRPTLTDVGRTTDGRTVIGGFFVLVAAHGVPLEVIVEQSERRGYALDWFGFWCEAMREGWNPGSCVTRVANAIGEVRGQAAREHAEAILGRISRYWEPA